jgi:hypothetical protein
MGSCDAAVIPEEAAGVETCVVVTTGPAPAWALEVVVLLVQPATRITARQTRARKTMAFLFDIFWD